MQIDKAGKPAQLYLWLALWPQGMGFHLRALVSPRVQWEPNPGEPHETVAQKCFGKCGVKDSQGWRVSARDHTPSRQTPLAVGCPNGCLQSSPAGLVLVKEEKG